MAPPVPDSSPSNARTPSRSSAEDVPGEVRGNSQGSAISTLSGSASVVRRVEQRNELTLLQLSNVESPVVGTPDTTPALPLGPLAEEDALDSRYYNENAGASDSEEEIDDDDIRIHGTELMNDQHIAKEDNRVAQALLEDFILAAKEEEGTEEEQPWCFGAPLGWKPPSAPEGWQIPAPKINKGEPENFNAIDNPGGWCSYTYQAKFKKGTGEYLYHSLPTGATPVPANEEGKRVHAGWEFHYSGWSKAADHCRHGASKQKMFPLERGGSLDGGALRKLGLNKDRMQEADGAPDALFFFQLLLPIHLIDQQRGHEPVKDDPRQQYYASVSKWTNLYAVGELDLGAGYGHHYKNTNAAELLRWDGVLVMDGVRGGSDGAILRRFDKRENNTAFDKLINKSFTKTRWLELKRVTKLCNNLTAKKRGQDGYNPAYKYDYIFNTIIHNVNALTLRACLDLCGDETTFGHQGFGEPDSGLLSKILGKPGITKGMQTVVVCDVDRIRPRAFLHRHKKHRKIFNQQGPNEVALLWEEQLQPLTTFQNKYAKQLFSIKPHLTWDNFFSGDVITEYAAEQGFGFTTTVRRDRLPSGVPGKYWHKEKTTPVAHRPKAARFNFPIVATKQINESHVVFTSFQSTSSCNIVSVNGLNACTLYAHSKERGLKNSKRRWAIEMNEARELYLNSYGGVDRLDHLMQNCKMSYR